MLLLCLLESKAAAYRQMFIFIPSISHPSLVITGKPAVTNDPNLQGDTITIARAFITSTYCSASVLWTEMHMHTLTIVHRSSETKL